MKLGIELITTYIPQRRWITDPETLGMTYEFLDHTVGIRQMAVIEPDETGVSCCEKAFRKLTSETQEQLKSACRLVVVVGQTLDTNMPHTSAILHGKLGLSRDCVCFDLSLGCTGFVHGLSIVQAFMAQHGLRSAMLFNVELMSRIVDRKDRGTGPIFGDGTTLTILSDQPVFAMTDFSFGTQGALAGALQCQNFRLSMDGKAVYEFVSRNVPGGIQQLLKKNGFIIEQMDRVLLHQASRRTVDRLRDFFRLTEERVPFQVRDYGNLGACSIPVLLAPLIAVPEIKQVLICGFGVGLAWAAGILSRIET